MGRVDGFLVLLIILLRGLGGSGAGETGGVQTNQRKEESASIREG
jgi:hypothetical protein